MKTFEDFYTENYEKVLLHITMKTKDQAVAEDVVADAFIKMYNHFDEFNTSKGGYLNWAKFVATNAMIDHYRTDKYGKNTTSDTQFVNAEGESTLQVMTDEDCESHINASKTRKEIAKAFRTLKPNMRKVAIQRFLRDKDYKTIATDLDMSMSNVKVMVMRSKAVLQQAFA